ncbi:hypothetical protein RN001_011592 [Aquatica leii]|uniref:Uncharacterized protein n=1 Tax=Aquatica leii TaxID=1421715 RepID=A0AAN7NXJ4_9COLE|nr:hypothetical protein RN001_011592 [Aquatica leii]
MEEHIRRVQLKSDKCRIEQLSITLRVVAFNSTNNKYSIEEFFIGYFEAIDLTGKTLGSAKKYVTELTLKPLSATRWSSRVDALKPLRFQLCEIYDALIEITEDVNRDAKTKIKAREFPAETEVRARRKKRQFDYDIADEPLTGEKKFKINFINYILDITLNSLNERFTLLETHNKNFQCLYNR